MEREEAGGSTSVMEDDGQEAKEARQVKEKGQGIEKRGKREGKTTE